MCSRNGRKRVSVPPCRIVRLRRIASTTDGRKTPLPCPFLPLSTLCSTIAPPPCRLVPTDAPIPPTGEPEVPLADPEAAPAAACVDFWCASDWPSVSAEVSCSCRRRSDRSGRELRGDEGARAERGGHYQCESDRFHVGHPRCLPVTICIQV